MSYFSLAIIKPIMKNMIPLIITILSLYVAIHAFFYFFQSNFLFYPQPITSQFPVNGNTEEVNIKTAENKLLHGWLCKTESQKPQKLIIYFGGNAEEVSHFIPVASEFEDWALLLVNYPGYGNSQGKPGEKSFFKAALEIYDYAVSREDIDGEHIVLMGRSIGTGSATYLANQRKVKGVVLFSPFESMRAVAQSKFNFLFIDLILKHKFRSKKYAKKIAAPMLAFYGTEDRIIPPNHTKKLNNHWKGVSSTVEIRSHSHNDLLESQQVWEKTIKFLKRL